MSDIDKEMDIVLYCTVQYYDTTQHSSTWNDTQARRNTLHLDSQMVALLASTSSPLLVHRTTGALDREARQQSVTDSAFHKWRGERMNATRQLDKRHRYHCIQSQHRNQG